MIKMGNYNSKCMLTYMMRVWKFSKFNQDNIIIEEPTQIAIQVIRILADYFFPFWMHFLNRLINWYSSEGFSICNEQR